MSARDEDEWKAKSNRGRNKRDEGHEIDIVVGGYAAAESCKIQEQKMAQPLVPIYGGVPGP